MSDEEPSVESLRERLETVEKRLDAAETEADLDEVEAEIEELESDVETADLPEPDEEDEGEDETPPEEALGDELEALEADLEEARGPYLEDVQAAVDDAVATVEEGDWTEDGEDAVADAVATYVDEVDEVDEYIDAPSFDAGDPALALEALEGVAESVADLDLDPDEDAETIEALLTATEELAAALDAAEEWDDLTVREQFQEKGFYDVVEHNKDFPPEWSALKDYERRYEPEPILMAYETFDSDFMEEHCLDALERMGPEEALDVMLQRAEKRNKRAISILGKIGDEEAVDTILDYVDADVGIATVTIRALGEIGSEAAVQPIADQLVADSSEVRSAAARALGLIGDTRAIAPLEDVLADEDERGAVRASAAWALVQIGTEDALEVAGEYADDRASLVQTEAQKARDATASA